MFKILNFSIFFFGGGGGVQENEYFWGYYEIMDIWGSSQNWEGGGGLLNSNIFFDIPDVPDIFLVNSRVPPTPPSPGLNCRFIPLLHDSLITQYIPIRHSTIMGLHCTLYFDYFVFWYLDRNLLILFYESYIFFVCMPFILLSHTWAVFSYFYSFYSF